MPSWSQLALFVPAALVLALVPGPAVLFIVSRSVEHGRTGGYVSAAGIAVGNLVHAAAAVLGVSLVVARSAELFTVLKLAGAAYLIALGVIRLVRRGRDALVGTPPAPRLRRVFTQAVVVNVLNTKVAIFFVAFLPQFVVRSHGEPWVQMAVLGLCWTAVAFSTDVLYATASSFVAARVRRRPRLVERASGAVYTLLGVTAALARRPAERAA